eukprot:CAMPEP_0206458244 /NCGR_PEP_ID=MMETSP0324_2-20121206/23450_1 /ASSEMBLY_ACC=CAM_ASM_000836 /TAXON_ID=2866 /ORGANISM="Crypthecodinium cohnii, Strain Seligo" /LENGTH=188 /DNA_ID=CAMNT_0053929537 /DNA_START=99 /DNA_END=666 /DNA_ORIENTATION=-
MTIIIEATGLRLRKSAAMQKVREYPCASNNLWGERLLKRSHSDNTDESNNTQTISVDMKRWGNTPDIARTHSSPAQAPARENQEVRALRRGTLGTKKNDELLATGNPRSLGARRGTAFLGQPAGAESERPPRGLPDRLRESQMMAFQLGTGQGRCWNWTAGPDGCAASVAVAVAVPMAVVVAMAAFAC